ncbi:hypothetical protein Dimus_016550 [Dionaea muscipula]
MVLMIVLKLQVSACRAKSILSGDGDVTEKPVEPVKVYSEKELIREIEKIASTLIPDKDWSIRIAALQRVEGLVIGGAIDYPCFRGLLKQLIGPLSTQLSDRRSSIVKQACHLLCFLSKELLGDFEACAEMFIPALFKLVVITVLVIAESADNCIKTMLRNCKLARILPRIADSAKNDRNAVLRARCCEYALLILEYWADAPEIQRSADLYEDLIKCCVGDAMSEAWVSGRMSAPGRVCLIINEEDGGLHRRHASPSVRDRNVTLTSHSPSLNLPGFGTSAIVTMDKNATLSSGPSVSSTLHFPQSKSLGKGTDRSLESMLHSSKQKVTAIESMLRGLDLSEKHNPSLQSSSLDLGVDPPSSRDPPFPLAVPASTQVTTSSSLDSKLSALHEGRNGGLVLSDIISQIQASKDAGKLSNRSGLVNEPSSAHSSYSAKRFTDRLSHRGIIEDTMDIRETRRYMNSHMDRQYLETPYRDTSFRDSQASYVPNFQRPLSRKNATGRMSSGRRGSFDDSQLPLGEMPSYMDGPASLNDALSEGLSPTSDWCARVAAFNYVRSLLQQDPKGTQEIIQNFEKVMKLFFQHLDDPHHKVAQAALSTLAEIIPSCRKPFESYMERTLPHVFSRLIDPKELVRQPCTSTLEIVSKTYGIDSLLPALLRSLDEQRSPKAKLAVIEFATSSFNKHLVSSEGSGNLGILKLWLAKLTPLIHDKNTKLKEAAITCFISVYSHYDPTAVLNFIVSLSVEEQNALRRALKQYTPRIEVELVSFLQSKKDKQRSKTYDSSDVIGTSSEEGYVGVSKKSHFLGRYSAGSPDTDGGRKWNSSLDSTQFSGRINPAALDDAQEHYFEQLETGPLSDVLSSQVKDTKFATNLNSETIGSWGTRLDNLDIAENMEALSTPCLDTNGLFTSEQLGVSKGLYSENGVTARSEVDNSELPELRMSTSSEAGPSIPQILQLISDTGDLNSSTSKHEAIQQLVEASASNDPAVWTKYFNQIMTVLLVALDDNDSSIRELVLLLIAEMLKNQKDAMEDFLEIVIEKLLHVSKDTARKVANEAENCLTSLLSQYDPFRCLNVIVPLLVTEDEQSLVTCINCLTKLVGRLSQEELMAQLPSFLPALFDAFGNQSADVRKTVVFCLVDIYIMLDKAFLPYLEGLNSTQLRLVTIYANRISQARTGTTIDTHHG